MNPTPTTSDPAAPDAGTRETPWTPGPWTFRKAPDPYGDRGDEHEIHWSPDGECVAEIVHGEADARLIAAAPDLFVALANLMSALDVCRVGGSQKNIVRSVEARRQAEIVLARATDPKPSDAGRDHGEAGNGGDDHG